MPDYSRSIYSLGFITDGKQVYASGPNNSVSVYDISNGQLVRSFSEQKAEICWIAISSDNQYLATGARDNAIRLFDLTSARLLHIMTAHDSWVWGVEFSPDSQRLYSASRDGTVAIWSIPDCSLLSRKKLHNDEINGLAVSSNGEFLATASDDRTVRIWDNSLSRGKILEGHKYGVTRVRFLGDGSYLASCDIKGWLFIWTTQSDTPLLVFNDHGKQEWAHEEIWGLYATPNNNYVVSSGLDGLIIVRNIPSGDLVAQIFTFDHLLSVAFHEQSGSIVAGGHNGSVTLWKLGNPKSRQTLVANESDVVILSAEGPAKTQGFAIGEDKFGEWMPKIN
jgi:WD40 repeat protein